MNLISKFSLLLFLLYSSFCFSQEIKTTRDIGSWTALSVDYKWNKKWQTSATQELRTFNNALKIEKSITDFGVDYKINKQFRLGGGLRYAYNREKNNVFSHNIRYNTDLKIKWILTENIDLQYRFRYQSNYESPFTGFSDFRETSKTRNRIKLEFELEKHSLYLGTELFREHVNYRKARFSGLRFIVGDKYETQRGELNYGLGYERELNQESPLNYFFLRLYYTLKLNND